MKLKQKTYKNVRLTWQELNIDGTISNRTYACNDKAASWHQMQMRKSPTLKNIRMEKL